MTTTKTILTLALIGFLGVNAYAVAEGAHGLVTFFTEADRWTWVAVCDVLISLSLVSVWMFGDARRRGVSPVPYLALTWTTGSIGPLVYLLRRED